MHHNSTRVLWVDIAKGFAILFVIIGHSWTGGRIGEYLQQLVYSFHMPIFFILSGVTLVPSDSWERLFKKGGKTFCHLMWPAALILFCTCLIYSFPRSLDWYRPWEMIRQYLMTLVYPSGAGIPWFFVALWSGRFVFDLLLKLIPQRWIAAVSCVLCGCAYVLFRFVHLPLFMDLALFLQPFFVVGHMIGGRKDKPFTAKESIFAALIWLGFFALSVALHKGRLATPSYIFPMFPLCIVEAMAGSIVVISVAQLVERNTTRISNYFVWLGQNSLYLLIVHALDGVLRPVWFHGGLLCVVPRIVIDLIILAIIVKLIKKLRRL